MDAPEKTTASNGNSMQVMICQTCGNEGFTNAFVYCIKCLGFVIHRYCLDVIPRTTSEFVPWFCEDCKPAVASQFILQKLEPSRSQKEDAISPAPVKTAYPKKKKKNGRKKKKISPLAAVKDKVSCPKEFIVPYIECVPHSNSPLEEASEKSNSVRNQITPCAVSQLKKGVFQKRASESAQLDNCSPLKVRAKMKRNETSLTVKTKNLRGHCSPPKGSGKRKRNGTPLAVKTKKLRIPKTVDSIEHSCCDSSCTNITSKNKMGLAHPVEERRCEIQPSRTTRDKLVSDSSSIEKDLNKTNKDYDGQAVTTNQMHNKQDIGVSITGADVSQSADLKDNLQYIYYESARPVLDPVWRGSFNITQTDYDLFEGFVGHLSSKACYKVCTEASMLPSLLCLEMHPKTALWPKSFLESPPSDENIALYFFPGDTRNERAFEHLVMDMIDEGLAMKATAKNAELLIFTSMVLPQPYRRFQGKYYLWGVFKGKRNDSSSLNHNLAVSNNSNNHGLSENSLNEATSGKKILASVKTFDSRSPQSPLCNYG